MSTSPMSPTSRRGPRLRLAGVAAVAVALAIPASASAATDTFLKLTGSQYDGETLDRTPGFEIDSASFDIANAGRLGAPQLGDLVVVKRVDRASPALMLAAATAIPIPSARLSMRRTDAISGSGPFLEYCFENVVVLHNEIDHHSTDNRPRETVTIRYERVTQAYRPTNKDGSLAAPLVAGWSGAENRPISLFPSTCGAR